MALLVLVHSLVQQFQEIQILHTPTQIPQTIPHGKTQLKGIQMMAVEGGDPFLDPLRRGLEFLLTPDFKNDDEFITAVAGNQVPRAQASPKDLTNPLQYPVSQLVPVVIVDCLETIDIDQDATILLHCPTFRAEVIQKLIYLAAVGQSRQMIHMYVGALQIQIDDQEGNGHGKPKHGNAEKHGLQKPSQEGRYGKEDQCKDFPSANSIPVPRDKEGGPYQVEKIYQHQNQIALAPMIETCLIQIKGIACLETADG